MSKRARDELEEDGLTEAAMELASTLSRGGLDLKLRALDRIGKLIDHGDEIYANQRTLVDTDATFSLVELLADESDAVAVRAAAVIALITDHSAHAKARLRTASSGPLLGVESSLSKTLLNPVQDAFIEAGAVAALVPWLCGPVPRKAEAALEALSNISSYNFEGKLAYLDALVDALAVGHLGALKPLEGLVDSMECGSEGVMPVLERLQPLLLQALRVSAQEASQQAMAVLGALCEKVPALAQQLGASEAPELLAGHLLNGPLPAQDVAVHVLWHLSLGDAAIWGADGALGGKAQAVARKLEALLDLNAEQEERKNEDDNWRSGSGGSYDERENERAEEEVCYAEEAEKLLASVAALHPELEFKPADLAHPKNSCIII